MPKITGWKRTVRRNLDEALREGQRFDYDLGRWVHEDGTEVSFFRPMGEDWTVDEYWVMWKLPSGEKFRYTILDQRVEAEQLCRDLQRAYSNAPISAGQFANRLADRSWVRYLPDAPEGHAEEQPA